MSAGRIRQRATDSGWRVARGDSGHLGADVASHSRLFRLLASLPGISAGLIRQVRAGVETAGLPYTPFLVLGGIPLKLYGAAAFSAELSPGSVLLWTGFARLVRIAPTFLAVAALRGMVRQRIDARPGAWLAALGLVWVLFYALYFERMARV